MNPMSQSSCKTKKHLLFSFRQYLLSGFICLISFNLIGQSAHTIKWTPSQEAHHSQLDPFFKKYQIVRMDELPEWKQLSGMGSFKLNLPDFNGNPISWECKTNSILSESIHSYSLTDHGLIENGRPNIQTFQGKMPNAPKNTIALTLAPDFFYGVYSIDQQLTYFEPLYMYIQGVDPSFIILYHPEDVIQTKLVSCGAEENGLLKKVKETNSVIRNGLPEPCCKKVILSVASDFSEFQKYGQNLNTLQAHHTGVINNVQVNYTGEFSHNIQFVINEFWTSQCNSCDPWTNSTSAPDVLNSFQIWGLGGGFNNSDYQLAQFWTNRDFDGTTVGIAHIHGTCTSERYFAVQDYTSNADLIRCVVAHEIGHNFNYGHDSGTGYIMSPSPSTTNVWSPPSKTAIDEFTSNIPCLEYCNTGSPPQLDFSTDTLGCVPYTVQFTNNSSDCDATWNWTFPGGNPASSTDKEPTITYPAIGYYDVTLIGTNPWGSNTLQKKKYVHVIQKPTSLFTMKEDDPFVTFTNQSVGGSEYHWDFGDGEISSNFAPVHEYTSDGTFTVTLTVTNICGLSMSSQVVTIQTVPHAAFTVDTFQGCIPLTVHFKNTSSINAKTFQWKFPGGSPALSTLKDVTVSYIQRGNFDVQLKVSNPAGSDSIRKEKIIHALDKPITAFLSFIFAQDSVQFFDSTLYATTIKWYFGDGDSSLVKNPKHSYAKPGNNIVTLYSKNSCGIDSLQDTISIGLPPIAIFDTNSIIICPGDSIQFHDLSQQQPTGRRWMFLGGVPDTSYEAHPWVIYPNPGKYAVTLQVWNAIGGDTLMIPKKVQVLEKVKAQFEPLLSFGHQLQLINLSLYADHWIWNFGDGSGSNMENPTHIYTKEGTYQITSIATNACGSDTISQTLQVVVPPKTNFTVDPLNICVADTLQFMDQSTGGNLKWNWSFPGGVPTQSNEKNPKVVYSVVGTYPVSLEVMNIAGSMLITKNTLIHVIESPLADFNYTVNSSTLTFNNTSLLADSVYWDFGDNQFSSEWNPVHTYSGINEALIQLFVFNDCGVDTMELLWKGTFIIDPFKQGNLFIAPNPASNLTQLHITGPATFEDILIQVRDLLGKIYVHDSSYHNKSPFAYPIHLNLLSPGYYIIEIQSGNNHTVLPFIKYANE